MDDINLICSSESFATAGTAAKAIYMLTVFSDIAHARNNYWDIPPDMIYRLICPGMCTGSATVSICIPC